MPRNTVLGTSLIAGLRACHGTPPPAAVGPRVQRAIVLRGATGAIRTATFQSREHIVVPVVALVEGVLHAVNAPNPELVLAEEFSKFPDSWNGRPVMLNHPFRNGEYVSANVPSVLEAECFGSIFGSRIDGRRLAMEAWLDPSRAEAVGPDAVRVIERANAGEPIEISVGTFMALEATSGVHNGKAYSAVWRSIVPDHLAMLAEGHTGACSNEMGCGVRAASALPIYVVTPRGLELEGAAPTQEPPSMKRTLKARFLSLVAAVTSAATDEDKFRIHSLEGAEDVSDVELRGKLHDALRAVEPGFLWIEEVFPADNLVIFAVEPERELLYIRRHFALSAEGTVTIPDGTREQVTRNARWDAITVAGATPKAACGCGGKTPTATSTAEGAAAMKTKTERVTALIASKRNTFTAAHQSFLEAQSDEQLKTLEELDATAPELVDPATPPVTPPAATPAATPTTPTVAGAAPTQVTEEDFLKTAPQSIRDLVAEDKARKTARKTAIIAALEGKQDGYSKEELSGMTVDQLEKVARVAKVATAETEAVDFGGRGLPRASANDGDQTVPAAPDFVGAVRTAHGVK